MSIIEGILIILFGATALALACGALVYAVQAIYYRNSDRDFWAAWYGRGQQ